MYSESSTRVAGLLARPAAGELMRRSGGLWALKPACAQTVSVGIVGGSDLHKIQEQLGDNGARRIIILAQLFALV